MRWIGAGLFMTVAIAAAYEKATIPFLYRYQGIYFWLIFFAYPYYDRYTDDEIFIIIIKTFAKNNNQKLKLLDFHSIETL